jgi:hypothetical protein
LTGNTFDSNLQQAMLLIENPDVKSADNHFSDNGAAVVKSAELGTRPNDPVGHRQLRLIPSFVTGFM